MGVYFINQGGELFFKLRRGNGIDMGIYFINKGGELFFKLRRRNELFFKITLKLFLMGVIKSADLYVHVKGKSVCVCVGGGHYLTYVIGIDFFCTINKKFLTPPQ